MDIKKLRHAIALSEEGNFARAAAKIHLTQSALSRSIQSLENELDLKLFERHSNGVRPTIAGLKFLESARDLLRRANSLALLAGLLKGAEIGDVAFGVGPVPAHLLLPHVLTQISLDHPKLKVKVEIQPGTRLMEWLIDEHIEFFVASTTQFIPSPDIHYEPLLTLPSGLYVRSNHPLLKTSPRMEDLQQYPLASPSFAFPEHTSDSHNASTQPIENLFKTWERRINCESVSALTAVTLASDAIMMTSTPCIKTQLESGLLQPLPLLQGTSQLSVVHLKDRHLSPAAEKIISLMKVFDDTNND